MASKGTANASKKKPSAGLSSDGAMKSKFKLPSAYIARPLPTKLNSFKDASTAIIHPEVMKELGINPGSMCILSKLGSSGIVVLAKPGDGLSHPVNVIMLSSTTRSVGSILFGDRLEINMIQHQPSYATKVTIGCIQRVVINDNEIRKDIERILDDCGIIMPGFTFNINQWDVVVVDVQDSSLPDVSKCDLNQDSTKIVEDSSPYISPPVIFRRGFTKIEFTREPKPSSRFSLSRSVDYNSVGGLAKEVEILKNTIHLPLHKPNLFSEFGVAPPRGILLHGPPGTGKTMLLRCVANTTDAHILTINGPSIVSKYLGETEATLREIFDEAKIYQPSIIFIDELDSIAPNRASDDSGEVESRVVATLLTLMDGMGASGRLVVVAATNRPNNIDPALRRPGRFDQEVEIPIPDVEARVDILIKQFERMSSEKHSLSAEDIKDVATKTHGYVGADLIALCRESVMKAIQRVLKNDDKIDESQLVVSREDLDHAMLEIRPSAMREIFLEMPKVYWTDIGGQDVLKRKMKEMIQLPLEASETFARLGVSAPKGVLLYGPPGCSKTLTAKALATESGVNFLAVKGPEIFSKYVGESERAIRAVFHKARSAAPSIIFFDEIDAISSSRDGGSSTAAASNVLTSLLNEIDGVEELKGVVIVAATNRPDEIDSALLRPGRLDRHIYVGPPDYSARLQILKKCTRRFSVGSQPDFDLERLANSTDGCSGAEIVLLCQEAGLAAIMEDVGANKVESRHFEKALSGLSKVITPEMLAYYEDFASRSGVAV